MKKVLALGVAFLCICLSGVAQATPNDDLVTAASKADLEGMKKALHEGADPNVSVCVRTGAFIAPITSSGCNNYALASPLIWGFEQYVIGYEGGGYQTNPDITPEQALAVETLLADSGAKADTFAVNRKTGEIIKREVKKGIGSINSPGSLLRFIPYPYHGKGPERALVFVKAGYAISNSDIDDLKRIHRRKDDGADAAEKLINSLESLQDPVAYCKREFGNSETIDALQQFIDKYQANDVCHLVPQAKKKVAILVAQEKQRAKEEAAAAAKQAKDEKAAAAKQAKEDAARQAKEQRQIAAFRKSVGEGDATNCGAVIEAKPKMVKVSFAVANYGNEHWIRRDQIFPAGYGCRFYNGEYQPPQ